MVLSSDLTRLTERTRWNKFIKLVEDSIVENLRGSPFNVPDDIIEKIRFSGHSLIMHTAGVVYKEQWPHFDVLRGGQAVVILSDNSPSTRVYAGQYDTSVDVQKSAYGPTPKELAVRAAEEAQHPPPQNGMTWDQLRDTIATTVTRDRAEIARNMISSR